MTQRRAQTWKPNPYLREGSARHRSTLRVPMIVWGEGPPSRNFWATLQLCKLDRGDLAHRMARLLGADPAWAVHVLLSRTAVEYALPRELRAQPAGVTCAPFEYVAVDDLRGRPAVYYAENVPGSVLCAFPGPHNDAATDISAQQALESFDPSRVYVIPQYEPR